jgi:hypothetical protein
MLGQQLPGAWQQPFAIPGQRRALGAAAVMLPACTTATKVRSRSRFSIKMPG